MIYFEYVQNTEDPNYGLVTYIHYEAEKLKEHDTSKGVFVESIPEEPNEEGYNYLLKYDPAKKVFSFKSIESTLQNEDRRPVLQNEIRSLIQREVSDPNLLSAQSYYNSLNKESATIEELRQAKYNAIKEKCDQHILGGFYSKLTDAQYGFSDIDQMNMTQQMILFFINPSPIMWKTEDKGLIQLTKEKFLGVAFEAQAHKEKQIQHWWKLKANIIAAQTKEEIMEFEWDGTIL